MPANAFTCPTFPLKVIVGVLLMLVVTDFVFNVCVLATVSLIVPLNVVEGEVPTANTVLVVPFVPLSPTLIAPLNVCVPPVMSLFKLIVSPVIVTDDGLRELVPVRVVGSEPTSPLSVTVLPVASIVREPLFELCIFPLKVILPKLLNDVFPVKVIFPEVLAALMLEL